MSVGELSTLFIAVNCFVASIFDMKRRNEFFLFLSFLSIRSLFLHSNTFNCFTHFEVRILSCIHFRFHFLSLLASIVACLLLHDQL